MYFCFISRHGKRIEDVFIIFSLVIRLNLEFHFHHICLAAFSMRIMRVFVSVDLQTLSVDYNYCYIKDRREPRRVSAAQ